MSRRYLPPPSPNDFRKPQRNAGGAGVPSTLVRTTLRKNSNDSMDSDVIARAAHRASPIVARRPLDDAYDSDSTITGADPIQAPPHHRSLPKNVYYSAKCTPEQRRRQLPDVANRRDVTLKKLPINLHHLAAIGTYKASTQQPATGATPPKPTMQDARVDRLSKEQVEEIEESFNFFDKNGDGSIVSDELSTVMRSLGMEPSETELAQMMREFDIDGNGTIDYDEFLKMMAKKMIERERLKSEQNTKMAFDVFDRDGNGIISERDLRQLFNSFGEIITDEELQDMIRVADLDGDNGVNFEEFSKVTSQSLAAMDEQPPSPIVDTELDPRRMSEVGEALRESQRRRLAQSEATGQYLQPSGGARLPPIPQQDTTDAYEV